MPTSEMPTRKMLTSEMPTREMRVFIKEQQTVDRSIARFFATLLGMPLAVAASTVVPLYITTLQKMGMPFMQGTGISAFLTLGRKVGYIYPTVVGKQAGKGVSSATKKIETELDAEAGQKPSPIFASFAVLFQALISGTDGLMYWEANGAISHPKGRNLLFWKIYAAAKFTPYTASCAALAAAFNVWGLTFISPWTKPLIADVTDNTARQKLLSVAVTAGVVSFLTTPINTVGGNYLAAMGVVQTGATLRLRPEKSLYEVVCEITKEGTKEGAKNLYRAWPKHFALMFLTLGSVEIVSHVVEKALPDYTVTVTSPFPKSSCTFSTSEKTQSSAPAPSASATR